MKKIIIATLFAFFSSQLVADEITGEMVYAKKIKNVCGFRGGKLSKKFTQREWQTLHDEHKLYETIHEICPELKPMKDEHLEHLFKFLYKFAKDVNQEPLC